MARSAVLVPFGWCPDGFTREEVKPGDERDFGDVTDGLKALKMIGDIEAKVETSAPVVVEAEPRQVVEVVEPDLVVEVVNQTPAEPTPAEPEVTPEPVVETPVVVEPVSKHRKRK